MPWTRKQVSPEQKGKMQSELHANPSIGHERKGSSALKKHKAFYGER